MHLSQGIITWCLQSHLKEHELLLQPWQDSVISGYTFITWCLSTERRVARPSPMPARRTNLPNDKGLKHAHELVSSDPIQVKFNTSWVTIHVTLSYNSSMSWIKYSCIFQQITKSCEFEHFSENHEVKRACFKSSEPEIKWTCHLFIQTGLFKIFQNPKDFHPTNTQNLVFT